jgi:endonuclease YncB( thermonuclease family)
MLDRFTIIRTSAATFIQRLKPLAFPLFVVNNLALFKDVEVHAVPQGTDKYGRTVAIVEIPEIGILQELLLQEGFAWLHPAYCQKCAEWEAMRPQAKNQGKGLWADTPEEPWEWRKKNKR